jgi:TPR repeat protein
VIADLIEGLMGREEFGRFRAAVSNIVNALRIASQCEMSRAHVELAHSLIGDDRIRATVNSKLRFIRSLEGSGPGAHRDALVEAGGELAPLVLLLWDGCAVVSPGLAVSDRFSLIWRGRRLSEAALKRLQSGRGQVMCFTGFEVWQLDPPSYAPFGGECEVVFELDTICLLPLLRRSGRGFEIIRGRALLPPFTPLRVRGVVKWEARTTVLLSCVSGWRGCVVGRRKPWPAVDGDAERLYFRALAGSGRSRAPLDLRETLSGLKGAASGGHSEAMHRLGRHLVTHPSLDPVGGIDWLQRAARTRHAGAMEMLGWAFREGKGVDKGLRVSMEWYRRAAGLGCANAMRNFGGVLEEVARENDALALEWYRKAAEFGNVDTMNVLGTMLMQGSCCLRDAVGGVKWLTKAADLGHARAMYSLGVMERDGRRMEAAVRWWRKAADLGDSASMHNLGCLMVTAKGFQWIWPWRMSGVRRQMPTVSQRTTGGACMS